ncbi:hypothetical protein EG328_009666 [Venturia inaequalis]|uniref:Protein kinase domain-containing protein n=1 Tax=Venturia inaequalis TaxID=5025 RepID=A0A8H3UNE8_VENIN|nr:hypothetical protein EG328_009666 [Venturia inaequalis]KAE9972718.1 hypothetical protein EG327_009419 [Venturia inaequalis]
MGSFFAKGRQEMSSSIRQELWESDEEENVDGDDAETTAGATEVPALEQKGVPKVPTLKTDRPPASRSRQYDIDKSSSLLDIITQNQNARSSVFVRLCSSTLLQAALDLSSKLLKAKMVKPWREFYNAHQVYIEGRWRKGKSSMTKHYGIHVKKHFDALDQSWYAAYANLDLAVPGTPARNEPLPMAENDYRVPTFFVGMGLTAPFPPAFLVHLNQQQAIIQQQLTNAYQQLSRINGPLFPDAGNLPAGEFCVPIQRPIDMLSKVIRVDDFQKIPCHAFSSFVDEDKKSTWYPKTDLGRGSYGRTMLWVKTDENDRIQERVVTKDVNLKRYATWYQRSTWCDYDRKLPLEVAIHRTLTRGNNPHIVPYRGFRLRENLQMFRLTTDFADGGDAGSLVAEFMAGKKETYRSIEKMPINYAWKFFAALVEAAVYIHSHGVVHRDLKVDNIFFKIDQDDDGVMGSWRLRPMVGDFGTAMPITPGIAEIRNPEDFDECGALEQVAPEQYSTEPQLLPGHGIGEKTTVFHIGFTMHNFLMYNKDPREFNEEEDDTDEDADKKTTTYVEGQDDDEDITEEVWLCSSSEGETDDEAIAELPSVSHPHEDREADCIVWRHERAMPQPRVHWDVTKNGGRKEHDNLAGNWIDYGERDKDEELLKTWLFDIENPPMTRHQKWKYLREHYQLKDGSEPFRKILIKCLRFNPDDRPTLDALLGMVKKAAGKDYKPSEKNVNILLKRKRAWADEEQIGRVYDHTRVVAAEKGRHAARRRLATSGIGAPDQ